MVGRFLDNVKRGLYPYTLKHLIIFLLTTAITTYITEHFLRYRLIKWIYVGVVTVTIVTLYKKGDPDKLALNAYNLSRV